MMQGKNLQKQASIQEANPLKIKTLQKETATQVVGEEVVGLVHLNHPHHKRKSQRVVTHP